MKKSYIVITLLFVSAILNGHNIREQLFNLPNVMFENVLRPYWLLNSLRIKNKQPIDHNDPSKDYFYQRAF